jgi:glucose-6-phosphate 1-dehydrogenase
MESPTLVVQSADAGERAEDPCVLVIFGASGDLARRMLLPALYDLAYDRRLPARFAIVGFARSSWDDEEFRSVVRSSVKKHARRSLDEAVWESFSSNLHYVTGNYDQSSAHTELTKALNSLDSELGTGGNRLYYMAVPPDTAPTIIANLRDGTSRAPDNSGPWSRLIVEKPFGKDLDSARKLNNLIHSAFPEDSVFRIDHYLGKETVQNILVFRFANGVFEPIWNRRYIDHVQITVAESLGVGERGGYYDQSGALRDMVQNHIMQLLALVAMEPPIAFDGHAVRNEKVKVFNALRRIEPDEVTTSTARGQYGAGWIGGEEVPGYAEDTEIKGSSTETFVAMRLFVDNWRWADVPFYIRTGKRLPKRTTEIAIQFRRAPHLLFRDIVDVSDMEPTVLTIRIQPNEGISLKFLTKVPGSPARIRPAMMDFLYGAAFLTEAPSAYETLLLDAIRGDATLFTRADEVEAAWEIMTAVLDGWEQGPETALPTYEAGTFGPEEADELIERDGRQWRRL